LESLQHALSHGIDIAAKIGYAVFKSSVLKALFIIDEEHLELAIEQDVDLLPLFLIYAPKWVKVAQGLAGRHGRGYERKVTLETSLKFLHDECVRKKSRYYDIIVNVPPVEGVEKEDEVEPVEGVEEVDAGDKNPKVEEVYPPPGADMKRVNWFYGNVKRLLRFIFHGEVPKSSQKWGTEHLRWLKKQEKQGRTDKDALLVEVHKRSKAERESKQNKH